MYYQKARINNYLTHRFACSMDAAHWAYGKNVPEEDVTIIKNGILTESFRKNTAIRNTYRKALRLEGKYVVGHIGRMVPQKNHEFLIDIFGEISRKKKNAQLVLIGDGPLIEKIKEKGKYFGLEEKITFLGLRRDVNKIMQAFDVFVFPSIFEGLGIVTIESQAASIPTICSEFVPSDVDVSNFVMHLSLNDSAAYWAEKIIKFGEKDLQEDGAEAVKKAGFDILEVTQKMQEFYLEHWSQNYEQ